MFVLRLIVALLSPFLNNTAVAMVFIPVFVSLAEQAEKPASMCLMPLSFVSILGGSVTLIGTSTNLVVHGEAVRRGYDALGMFPIAPLRLISLAVGFLYLFTVGRAQLPRRERPPDLSSKYENLLLLVTAAIFIPLFRPSWCSVAEILESPRVPRRRVPEGAPTRNSGAAARRSNAAGTDASVLE